MSPSACKAEYVRDSVVGSGAFSLVNFEESLERNHQLGVDEGKYGVFIDTLEKTAKGA
jgi:hypothetical protein